MERGFMSMTIEERKEMREIMNEGFDNQRKFLESVISPINEKVVSHDEIFQKVPLVEQRLDNHLNDHAKETSKKRFNIEMYIIVIVYIIDKIFM
jgi:hypothetical protein